MPEIYGKTFVIQRGFKAECWNAIDGSYARFRKGETIEVEHVNDATHTTICWSGCIGEKREGRKLRNADGTPNKKQIGYRFIVSNDDLSKAIGVEIGKTKDLVGDIIKYENGEASPEETEELFNTLRETGIGKQLQGHYSSRM